VKAKIIAQKDLRDLASFGEVFGDKQTKGLCVLCAFAMSNHFYIPTLRTLLKNTQPI
jgi:hypothetical protein